MSQRVDHPSGARPTKSERTKEAVLAAAEVLFSERGFDATTLDAIGSHAGMQGTAILYHFSTKRVLYEAVLDRMFTPLIVDVHGHFEADQPVGDRVAAITSTMVRFAAARPAAARLILREASTGSDEAGDIVGSASRRQWARFLGALDNASVDGNRDGLDPRVMWNVVIGAICFHFGGGSTVGALPGDPHDSAQVAEFEMLMVTLARSVAGLDDEAHL